MNRFTKIIFYQRIFESVHQKGTQFKSTTGNLVEFFNGVTKKFFFKNEDVKKLGRWNINYCDKTTNNKIDLANEDHCGTCSQYAITKTISNNKDKKV